MTIGPAPICLGCTRYRAGPDALTCEAFPDGIPDAILMSAADHRLPFPGDGGFFFDPVDEEAARYAAERFQRVG